MDSFAVLICYPFLPKCSNSLCNRTPQLHFHSSTSPSKNFRRLFKLGNSTSCKAHKNSTFDEAAFEAERLSLDAEAREAMAETSRRETEASIEEDPKAWKWVIRKRIWDTMEAQNFAQNPRPVHHRIPNFVGASVAAEKVSNSSYMQYILSVWLRRTFGEFSCIWMVVAIWQMDVLRIKWSCLTWVLAVEGTRCVSGCTMCEG